jgi:flavin-dependent dehydrogenase
MPDRFDVIVVGAGPAGAAAAARLAEAGLRVALLERAAGREPAKVCGEYLSPGCLPILQRLGALSDVLHAGGRPLRGVRLHLDRVALRAHYPGAPEAGGPRALAVSRRRLDPILLEQACRRGAELLRGFQVSGLLRDGPAVVGVRGRRAGRDACLRGRLVLGADGRHSVVARRLGPVVRHAWLDKVALVGHFAGVAGTTDAAEIFVGRARYAILNPLAPDTANVGMVVDRCELQPGEPAARERERLVPSIPGLADRLAGAVPLGPIRRLGPLAHRAARLTAPGAALLGDAAGFVDPFTGEGIYAALRSAELVARHALPALARESHPLLAGYAADWRREIGGKRPLCLLLQHAIRRPWLARALVARLGDRPRALDRLMGLVGDLRPASPSELLLVGAHLLLGRPAGG